MNKEFYISTRTVVIIAIVFLLLVILGTVLTTRSFNTHTNVVSKDTDDLKLQLSELNERLIQDSILIEDIIAKRIEDSTKHLITQSKLKEENRRLKNKLKPSSDFFALLNDTIGIHDQIVRRDSIIENDSLLIDDLEDERDSIKISYGDQINILQQTKIELEKDLVKSINQNIHNVAIIEEKGNIIQRLRIWLYGTGAVGVVLAVILTVALL